MKRNLLLTALALTMSATSWAQFTTKGNGTTWTMAALAETQGSGVSRSDSVFTMDSTVVVAKGDHFALEGGITVQMAKSVRLEIVGSASMAPTKRTLFTRKGTEVPGQVYLQCDNNITLMKNLDFEYVGVKYYGPRGLAVDDCTFRYHEAKTSGANSSAAALSVAGNGAVFTVNNCIFEMNKLSAIGGAGNATNPITVENCQFIYNDQQNRNYPQLNLTAASSIIVRNNIVLGDRQKKMGGGIMVADLLGVAKKDDPHTLIEANDVKDNRYGISVYSGQTAIVRGNRIVNNDSQGQPVNGGSGINITDAGGSQMTKIMGNYIEGNLWGVTIIGGKDINLGKGDDPDADDYNPGLNIFVNNGNEGQAYDLYNNSQNIVYAQNNIWASAPTQDAAGIESVIFHQADDASLGQVIFTPWATQQTVGIDQLTLESQTDSENTQTKIFTLRGTQVSQLQRGLNIVRQGQHTYKVLH